MYETIRSEFSSPLDVVTSCARSAFTAPPGYHFVVCDLSAIEARVLGWLANCEALNAIFRDKRDPYKVFATWLYNKLYEEVTKDERNASKPGFLGGGYQLSGGDEKTDDNGDVIKTGLWGYAAAMGIEITRGEAHRSVQVFRERFLEVPELWRSLEDAAIKAVNSGKEQQVGPVCFRMRGSKLLQLVLPSGRPLNYFNPEVQKTDAEGRNGTYQKSSLAYEGVNQKTRQWTNIDTYGGKWTENIDQATSRDILAHGMRLADALGFSIVGHVHDELITLVADDSPLTLADLERCMSTPPSWAPDLLLAAEGYEGPYYKKG